MGKLKKRLTAVYEVWAVYKYYQNDKPDLVTEPSPDPVVWCATEKLAEKVVAVLERYWEFELFDFSGRGYDSEGRHIIDNVFSWDEFPYGELELPTCEGWVAATFAVELEDVPAKGNKKKIAKTEKQAFELLGGYSPPPEEEPMEYSRKIEAALNGRNARQHANDRCCNDGDTSPQGFFRMGFEFAGQRGKNERAFYFYDGETWFFFLGKSEEEIIAGFPEEDYPDPDPDGWA